MKTLIDALNWRYATKRFDASRRVAEEDLEELLEAVRLSASSYGLQPFRFAVVSDPELKSKLRPAAFNQPQIEEASHLVVFTAQTAVGAADTEAYMQRIVAARGVSRESLDGFAGAINGKISRGTAAQNQEWAGRQAYIAVGTLLAAAALKEIDACPMEGFVPAQFDELLGLEAHGLTSLAVVALGYRSAEDGLARLAKVRKSKEELFLRY